MYVAQVTTSLQDPMSTKLDNEPDSGAHFQSIGLQDPMFSRLENEQDSRAHSKEETGKSKSNESSNQTAESLDSFMQLHGERETESGRDLFQVR